MQSFILSQYEFLSYCSSQIHVKIMFETAISDLIFKQDNIISITNFSLNFNNIHAHCGYSPKDESVIDL